MGPTVLPNRFFPARQMRCNSTSLQTLPPRIMPSEAAYLSAARLSRPPISVPRGTATLQQATRTQTHTVLRPLKSTICSTLLMPITNLTRWETSTRTRPLRRPSSTTWCKRTAKASTKAGSSCPRLKVCQPVY